jgi:hypothetical protein
MPSSCCRVHTLAVPIAQDLNALYAGADTGAIASIIAKLAVEKSLHGKLEVPPGYGPSCAPPCSGLMLVHLDPVCTVRLLNHQMRMGQHRLCWVLGTPG